jgi:hypothetical protein
MAPSALDRIGWLDLSGIEKERARNYKAKYRAYHGRPEQIKARSQRNAARAEMGLKVGDPGAPSQPASLHLAVAVGRDPEDTVPG